MRVFVMMSKSHKTTNEREREKGKQKREKKADGNFACLKRHTNRRQVKEFISVFEKFLHFFPSLRLM
jgi:hypothetical protein